MIKQSRFTGSAWGLFGWNILIILSTFLLFIPLAFVMPKYAKWYYSHWEIDGKKLIFDYEGPWWGYLGWMLFGFVTFGIGLYYATKKMMQFEISHTHVIGEDGSISKFNGSAFGIFGWAMISALGAYLLLIPLCFIIVSSNKWYHEHTIISGRRLVFTYEGAWWGLLGWTLFTLVTFGIGGYYAQKRQIQWTVENTHFIELM